MQIEEAIEKLKETAKQCRNSKECWENEDCCDCYVEVEDIFAIETVLNYIDTMHKELDRLEGIEDNTSMLKYELNEKDKIIDEMAMYLADIDFDECCAEIPEPCLSCSWEDYEPHTNCIKEYFYKKVSEEDDAVGK